jgi:hypothetical protein
MKYLLLFGLLASGMFSFSQSLTPEALFSSSGNHVVGGYGQISWTMGDISIRRLKTPTLVLTEGFLQTRLTLTGIEDVSDMDGIDIKLFPNPVKDILHIKYEGNEFHRLNFDLYSLDGRKILHFSSEAQMNSNEINFTGFQTGIYLLKISGADMKVFRTYKLIYNKD